MERPIFGRVLDCFLSAARNASLVSVLDFSALPSNLHALLFPVTSEYF